MTQDPERGTLTLPGWLLRLADPSLKVLVLVSTGFYVLELTTGARDTYQAHYVFLWTERLIALIFTLEYIFRWLDDASDRYGWHYPQSPMGLIDLISILPFWIGFFVPVDWLHLIRTFRVFRLLKFFRYSRGLQLLALGFYRASHHLKLLGFAIFVIGLFCTVAVYEIEHEAQPDKFTDLGASAWYTFVTMATIGYGDLFPVTPLGRAVAMACFFVALSVFAAALGVIGSSMMKVMDEDAAGVDPLDAYRQEKQAQLERRAAERAFGPHYKKG